MASAEFSIQHFLFVLHREKLINITFDVFQISLNILKRLKRIRIDIFGSSLISLKSLLKIKPFLWNEIHLGLTIFNNKPFP